MRLQNYLESADLTPRQQCSERLTDHLHLHIARNLLLRKKEILGIDAFDSQTAMNGVSQLSLEDDSRQRGQGEPRRDSFKDMDWERLMPWHYSTERFLSDWK